MVKKRKRSRSSTASSSSSSSSSSSPSSSSSLSSSSRSFEDGGKGTRRVSSSKATASRHHEKAKRAKRTRRHSPHAPTRGVDEGGVGGFDAKVLPAPPPEALIDWNDPPHRAFVNARFFSGPQAFLQQESPRYVEAFEFVARYNRHRCSPGYLSSLAEGPSVVRRDLAALVNVPPDYSAKYRVNARVTPRSPPPSSFSSSPPPSLPPDALSDFAHVLSLYEDYCQRRAFAKILKIKKDKDGLPIASFKKEIVEAVAFNPVVIIAGNTGCGKSTQVPQYLLEAGHTKIAVTQPRRIAAMSLCRRLAYETLNEHGSKIGYQVRFQSAVAQDTQVVFLTEGLLLRQAEGDRLLSRYNVVVIDEVHERHLFGDFLLAILRDLVTRRKDLKVVLMSATINIELFSRYFGGAPVIEVPGRLYPISIEYLPASAEEPLFVDREGRRKVVAPRSLVAAGHYLRILERVDAQYAPSDRGDMLVFLSGMAEIQAVSEVLRDYALKTRRWIVLALHSALSVEDQEKVFDVAPEGARKVILSTNIAETSVTIDGIRFVVDSGRVKEMGYDSLSRMQSLQETWISRASAEQRKGRAGRTGPGICYRLYTPQQFHDMEEFTPPEIKRESLDSLVLQIKCLGFGDPRAFAFIEDAGTEAIESALTILRKVGALTDDGFEELTPLGRVLARLPVPVSLGKMLVLASIFTVTAPMLTIAAALSVQSPFIKTVNAKNKGGGGGGGERGGGEGGGRLGEPSTTTSGFARPGTLRETAGEERKFVSEHGDPFTLLNVFDEWIAVKAEGGEASTTWCRRHNVNESRLYELLKLQTQFKEVLVDAGLLQERGSLEDSEIEYRLSGGRRGSGSGGYGGGGSAARRARSAADHAKWVELQRLQREQGQSRKVRVLTLETGDEPTPADGDGDSLGSTTEDTQPGSIDLQSLDFALSYDINELRDESNRNFTVRDINIMKVIMAAGLYPHVAMPDERNFARADSDITFHTELKQSVLPHPTSVFAMDASKTGAQTLLTYVTLLETNKPYLVNATAVPGLQAAVLVARCLDVNVEWSRLVVDNWLAVDFASPPQCLGILAAAIKLRRMLNGVLDARLSKGLSASSSADADSIGLDATALNELLVGGIDAEKLKILLLAVTEAASMDCSETQLSTLLAEFLEVEVVASFSRLHSISPERIFNLRGSQDTKKGSSGDLSAMEALELKSRYASGTFEADKAGLCVTKYLRVGSVKSRSGSGGSSGGPGPTENIAPTTKIVWTCPTCRKDMLATAVQRQEHAQSCSSSGGAAMD